MPRVQILSDTLLSFVNKTRALLKSMEWTLMKLLRKNDICLFSKPFKTLQQEFQSPTEIRHAAFRTLKKCRFIKLPARTVPRTTLVRQADVFKLEKKKLT